MITLHSQYDYEGSIKGIPELFEKITAKETGGIWLGSTPKNLGDVQLDENTFVDVKTSNVNGTFKMPNLSSQKKLLDHLKDETIILLYHFVFYEYDEDAGIVYVREQHTKHIEEIDPACLVVQAQGKGVLQIKNINMLSFVDKMERSKWIKEVLKPKVLDYLIKEEIKIEKTRELYLNI
jgi:hypothetical protein